MNPTRVKVCCIKGAREADLAMRYGASALGLVSEMPSGPGIIADDEIARIARRIPPTVSTFLLTSRDDADAIVEQLRAVGTDTVQIVDRLEHGSYGDIRRALPNVRIVQVIHVVDESSVEEAKALAPEVNALLLDSGNPALAVKELGGTGRVHDWALSKRIRNAVDVPVFLAGGLRAENVAEAIRAVEPFAVDLCSGVRTSDNLDEEKLAAFFKAVVAA